MLFHLKIICKIKKKHIRKRALQQIILRKSESSLIHLQRTSINPKPSKENFNGPVILNCVFLAENGKMAFENFLLTITEPDNCCQINEAIINIKNVALTA